MYHPPIEVLMTQSDEQIVAYVTKNALTRGILKVRGRVCHSIRSSMLQYRTDPNMWEYAHGNDWHRSESDAYERAEEMRREAMAACYRKIDRLEAIMPEVVDCRLIQPQDAQEGQ